MDNSTITPDDLSLYVSLVAGLLALFAVAISVYVQYITSKKTTFINTITTERIRWMANLRESVSSLCSTMNRVINTKTKGPISDDTMEEIERLMTLVDLLLNPNEDKHKKISCYISDIAKYSKNYDADKLQDTLREIINTTKILLKDTWDMVKKEAREGELIEEGIINPWLPEHLKPKIEPPKTT